MLKEIMHYIRQCRCEHTFEVETFKVKTPSDVKVPDLFGRLVPTGEILYTECDELVYMRCTKCGYHESHLKKGDLL